MKDFFVGLLVRLNKGEDVRDDIRVQILIAEAQDVHFNWINHPEYLSAEDVEERDGVVSGEVTYRGDKGVRIEVPLTGD